MKWYEMHIAYVVVCVIDEKLCGLAMEIPASASHVQHAPHDVRPWGTQSFN